MFACSSGCYVIVNKNIFVKMFIFFLKFIISYHSRFIINTVIVPLSQRPTRPAYYYCYCYYYYYYCYPCFLSHVQILSLLDAFQLLNSCAKMSISFFFFFKKPLSSLQQILRWSVTSIQLIDVFSGFRVFVPVISLFCCVFTAAILFLLRLISIPFCVILL